MQLPTGQPNGTKPVIIWFRRDLRITDHAPLHEAAKNHQPIIPLFIWSPDEEAPWAPGAASRWWLHHALIELNALLATFAPARDDFGSSRLIVMNGPYEQALLIIKKLYAAEQIYLHEHLEPYLRELDAKLFATLAKFDLKVREFSPPLLHQPLTITKTNGAPYSIFTPYYNAALKLRVAKPLPAPTNITFAKQNGQNEFAVPSLKIEELKLLPKISWDQGFNQFWQPWSPNQSQSVTQYLSKIQNHCVNTAENYAKIRDYPLVETQGEQGTSMISPRLHWGQITPKEVFHLVKDHGAASKTADFGIAYIRQIYWREFAHDLLRSNPDMVTSPMRCEFSDFDYEANEQFLTAWQNGVTGYPIVDAGMRQLWSTGWMHNRARMIVGSFLVKDLLLPWQEGVRWFWDTLVDANLANNSFGWQWIAGCGGDAAPYFRIFNPTLQSQKFDREGDYIHKYIPELAKLGDPWIHAPWNAPPLELKMASIKLGVDYPYPIVDHNKAKFLAMKRYQDMRNRAALSNTPLGP